MKSHTKRYYIQEDIITDITFERLIRTFDSGTECAGTKKNEYFLLKHIPDQTKQKNERSLS